LLNLTAVKLIWPNWNFPIWILIICQYLFLNRLKSFGVMFDSTLSFKAHTVNSVISFAYFHIRYINWLHPALSLKSTALVHALVTSRIDYCNTLFLNGLSLKLLYKLQLVEIQLLVLFAVNTLLPYYNTCIGSRLNIALILKSFFFLTRNSVILPLYTYLNFYFKIIFSTHSCSPCCHRMRETMKVFCF